MKKILKIIMIVLCVISLTTLTSCSNEDERTSPSIVGRWKVVQSSQNQSSNMIKIKSIVGQVWEFRTGGVLVVEDKSYSYSVNDKLIVIMGGLYSGTISSLSGSRLVLDLKVGITMSNQSSPITVHIEFTKL